MSPQEVLEFAKKNDAKQLDLRFTDIPSLQHHVSYPIHELDEASFEDGFGMDGSSIRGWAAIHESDMLLFPDPSTAAARTQRPRAVFIRRSASSGSTASARSLLIATTAVTLFLAFHAEARTKSTARRHARTVL